MCRRGPSHHHCFEGSKSIAIVELCDVYTQKQALIVQQIGIQQEDLI